MYLKEIARSLSFRRSSSSLSARNVESSILAESLTSESMRFSKYENLSKSMRLEDENLSKSMRLEDENLSKSMRLEDGCVIEAESECYGDFTGRVQRSASFNSWGRSKLKSISVFSKRINAGMFNPNVAADEFADKHKKKPTKPSHEMKEPKGKVKVKKRSSWLPDPSRRWPVQGW